MFRNKGKRTELYVLFSKSGFEQDLLEEAKNNSALILVEELEIL
ncbi:MAG: hypothetical protein ACOCXQ_03580 [Patescibacteria group bacterium]